MIFDVITLFPGMFLGPSQDGILARARRGSKIGIRLHDLRRWGVGPQRQVDDAPYGGGGGMILRPEPIFDVNDTGSPIEGRVGRFGDYPWVYAVNEAKGAPDS